MKSSQKLTKPSKLRSSYMIIAALVIVGAGVGLGVAVINDVGIYSDSSIENNQDGALSGSSMDDGSVESSLGNNSSEESSNMDSSGEDLSSESASDSSASHEHDFSQEFIQDEYLKSAATCNSKAAYYYVCDCGERGEEAFAYGSPLEHEIEEHGEQAPTCATVGWEAYETCSRCDYTTYAEISATGEHAWNAGEVTTQPTCVEEGEKKHTCTVCNNETKTEILPATEEHTWDSGVERKTPTCASKGERTYSCTVCTTTKTEAMDELPHEHASAWTSSTTHHWHACACGDKADEAEHTPSAPATAMTKQICTVCGHVMQEETGILFNTLNVDGTTVYGKVSNAAQTYSFLEEVTVIGNATFAVSSDREGAETLDAQSVSLAIGDNTVYLTEFANGKPVNVYTVTLRRKPTYTLAFDANGGTVVESKTVEEGEIISSPVTVKQGYTLLGWGYDFSMPIVADGTMTAVWEANNDTKYTIEHYLQNIDNDAYTLHTTRIATGTTDTLATAPIRIYEHFSYNAAASTMTGNIHADGSLVLRVYYLRDTYTLSVEGAEAGEVADVGIHKYGEEMDCEAIAYLGSSFLGWYHGEELLSTDTEYSFIMDKDVVAKFARKEELSDFYFTANATACVITGLKNTSATSIVVPACVTAIDDLAFYNCTNLTKVTIDNGVTAIGEYAFQNCTKLTSLLIPDSVKTIHSFAFWYCIALTEVTIGNGVDSIGKDVFFGCESLSGIAFADTASWFRTTSSSKWENKKGGVSTDVSNSSANKATFSKYYDYYWYKL